MTDQYRNLIEKYPELTLSLGDEPRKTPFFRPSFDQMYMAIALIVGKRSTCLRGQIGAVICKDTRIISIGYNGAPSGMAQCNQEGCIIDTQRGGCIRTIHAEQNAIAYACRIGIPMERATLYVTLSPCIDCAKLIIASGIKRVVYYEAYRKGYAIDFLIQSGVQVEHLPFGIQEMISQFP
jgi:dCMP deaminase